MDLEGRSVAVQMETTADYLVQRYVADGLHTELKQYEKVINAFDELKTGRVDAVCTDSIRMYGKLRKKSRSGLNRSFNKS